MRTMSGKPTYTKQCSTLDQIQTKAEKGRTIDALALARAPL